MTDFSAEYARARAQASRDREAKLRLEQRINELETEAGQLRVQISQLLQLNNEIMTDLDASAKLIDAFLRRPNHGNDDLVRAMQDWMYKDQKERVA